MEGGHFETQQAMSTPVTKPPTSLTAAASNCNYNPLTHIATHKPAFCLPVWSNYNVSETSSRA